jgi:hypothetical protein
MTSITKAIICICLFFAFGIRLNAQDSIAPDTTAVALDSVLYADSVNYYYDPGNDEAKETLSEQNTPKDSTPLVVRTASKDVIDKLKEDSALDYNTDSPAVWSVWDRFTRWLGDLINSLFFWSDTTDWGQVFTFIFVAIVLSFVILKLLKVDALKMFYGATQTNASKYVVLEENIHEMDFDKLIQEALRKKEFRLAIRLTFLQSLKILADHQHIYWEPGKTNHDYLNELKVTSLKSGFAQLNYYFEYAWYGNFTISQETFNQVKDIYTKWKGNLR